MSGRRRFLGMLSLAVPAVAVAAVPALEPDVIATPVQTPNPNVVINFVAPIGAHTIGREMRRAARASMTKPWEAKRWNRT